MEFIVLFLIIFTNSVLISNLLNKKIEQVIPIAVILITLVVYIAGLFDNLDIGVNIVELLSIFSTIYNIIYAIKLAKNKKLKSKIEEIATPGLLVYIMLYFSFIFLNSGRIFEDVDEFNHWGLIVKNMYMYNAYGTVEKSIIRYNEYPPFTATFQYILLNIRGDYFEDLIIISQNILYLSMIIPICQKINLKSLSKLLFVIPVIILIPLIFYEEFYVNILVDGFLGVLFALGLFIIYSDDSKTYKNIFLSLIITALSLTKTTGIVFAVLLLLFEIINRLMKKEPIKYVALVSICPIILTSCWYLKVDGTNKNWNFEKVWKDETSESIPGEFESTVLKRYVSAFGNRNVIDEKNLSIIITLLLLSVYSMYLYHQFETEQKKKNYKFFLICIGVSFVTWGIGLLWMYMTIFTEEEALILASFDRYFSTMLLAWTVFNSFILCDTEKNRFSEIYVTIVILISLSPMNTIYEKYIQCRNDINCSHVERNYYTTIKRCKKLFNDSDKIFLLSNGNTDNMYMFKICRYEMMGINIANNNPEYFGAEEDFMQILKEEGYTYIYIFRFKEDLKDNYINLFTGTTIQDDSLYKINLDGKENLNLEKINI